MTALDDPFMFGLVVNHFGVVWLCVSIMWATETLYNIPVLYIFVCDSAHVKPVAHTRNTASTLPYNTHHRLSQRLSIIVITYSRV